MPQSHLMAAALTSCSGQTELKPAQSSLAYLRQLRLDCSQSTTMQAITAVQVASTSLDVHVGPACT